MNLRTKALTKSLWVFHAALSPCNNCDIEVLDLLTPRHDIERFGITLVGSVRHADVLLASGVPTPKTLARFKELYAQTSQPCLVAAIGTCAGGGNMFRDSYNYSCDLDEIVPVDVYIPGCPPKPEAMIAGVVKLIEKVKGNS